MLPRIKIFFENGNLNAVVPSPDGVLGIVCTGAPVASTFALSTAYVLRSFAMLLALGVTEINNPSLYKIVKEFYDEAGDGTEVWIMCFPDTVLMSDLVDKDQLYASKLINAAAGRLRGIIVSRKPGVGYTPTITNGMDADVTLSKTNAQALAVNTASVKFAPIFVVLEGYAFSGVSADLTDLNSEDNNMVSVFIGSTIGSTTTQDIGTLAGRIAKSPVQRNVARVRDGALAPIRCFINTTPAELADVESIHNKGYITFRTYVGRSGYFFNDDFMATDGTEDFSHLTARRTIDKAFRICYDVLLSQLLDEIPVNANGTMQAPMVKTWQKLVENAIATQMTANGELSADVTDPKDRGVVCFIDSNQNIVSTSKMDVSVKVRPFGYPRYIDVHLGFQVVSV